MATIRMHLQTLLGDIPKRQFVAEHLHRLPFSLPSTAREFCSLGSWDVLGEILNKTDVDLMVVREGARSQVEVPADVATAKKLCEDGHTILVRHAERHHAEIGELAASFRREFTAPVDVHMYVTPPAAHGFSWHYDAEDVFIIQTSGAKQYSLRKNTVNPWPLVETIPADMRYERELMPLLQVELRAGDWLYIPCGYWHRAEALPSDDAAISLAVGVMSRSAIDLFDFLRGRLLDSMLWRQRLPVAGDAATLDEDELRTAYREIVSSLAADLEMQLTRETFVGQYLDYARRCSTDVSAPNE